MQARNTKTKWTQWAAITTLAIGPACADLSDPLEQDALEGDEDEPGELPSAASSLTQHHHAAAVPGFTLGIELGGGTGEDVVLDWSGAGVAGDAILYRSSDPRALLDLSLDEPLPAGVESTPLFGVTAYVDAGAASRTAATPHYFYRVGLVEQGPAGATLELSTMVMKTTTATGPGFNLFALCMLDGPTTASQVRDLFGPSVVGVHQRIAGGADFFHFRSWTPAGGEDFVLEYGAGVVAQFDGTAEPFHSLVGRVPTDEALAVTAEPGYNWMTIPALYDGPLTTSFWVDTVGYRGVGLWDNLAQASVFDWDLPGYDPLAMEVCRTYDAFLPDDTCTSNADCTAGQVCAFAEPAACGEVASGRCLPQPASCEGVPQDPVCGCDGVGYASQCEADRAGVGVRGPGSGAVGSGPIDFDAAPGPVLTVTGDWDIYAQAPPSPQHAAVAFPSLVLGTDGNRVAPYPGNHAEQSSATLGPVTLGSVLSLRSWHVDEGNAYDRKAITFESDAGQTWVLVDCNAGINPQAFCEPSTASRPGDAWDHVALDTAILAGETGTLRLSYDTGDGCCDFEQGWYVDDLAFGGCDVAQSGPPVPGDALDPDACPAVCLATAMYQALVLDPAAPTVTACSELDLGDGTLAFIEGQGGYAMAYWDAASGGLCESYSPATGYVYYDLDVAHAQSCTDLVSAQIAALGPACDGP